MNNYEPKDFYTEFSPRLDETYILNTVQLMGTMYIQTTRNLNSCVDETEINLTAIAQDLFAHAERTPSWNSHHIRIVLALILANTDELLRKPQAIFGDSKLTSYGLDKKSMKKVFNELGFSFDRMVVHKHLKELILTGVVIEDIKHGYLLSNYVYNVFKHVANKNKEVYAKHIIEAISKMVEDAQLIDRTNILEELQKSFTPDIIKLAGY